jgi:hypothetical protein
LTGALDGGSRAWIAVHCAAPPPGHLPAPGSAAGLTGLRERVVVLGGELTAGPADDGGFEISATFPTPGAHRAAAV